MANIKAGDVRTFDETLWEPSTWPSHAQGVGFTEAPRGALAHWVVIDDGRISNYQAVVPPRPAPSAHRGWGPTGAGSRTIGRSCRAPGTRAHAMQPAPKVRTRRR